MEFTAIDVETANADMSSICQVGIAEFKNGELINSEEYLINPEDYFDDINVSIHGITEGHVKNAPKLPEIQSRIYECLNNKICVCHTHFDRVSLPRAYAKYNLELPNISWLDTAMVARRTWSNCAYSGYGLVNLYFNILKYPLEEDLCHHNAKHDAIMCGRIMLSALKESGLSLEEWFLRVKRPINNSSESYSKTINQNGNPEGAFYGENLAFTGALLKLPRNEAAKIAAEAGFNVKNSVTKKTTILVVGSHEIHEANSSKHKKALELTTQGQQIKIITEEDFYKLIETEN